MITKKYSPKQSALASLRFDGKCFCCDNGETHLLELDHNIAKSLGGENANFTPLCPKCNKRKGKLPLELFYTAEVLQELERRLSLQFSDAEILSELSRLVKLEMDYVSRCKGNVNVSEACKRAMAMRGM